MLILICTFRRIRLFTFYLFFERRLIPASFLILGWGYQPEILQAGIYLLFAILFEIFLKVSTFKCSWNLELPLVPSFTIAPMNKNIKMFSQKCCISIETSSVVLWFQMFSQGPFVSSEISSVGLVGW